MSELLISHSSIATIILSEEGDIREIINPPEIDIQQFIQAYDPKHFSYITDSRSIQKTFGMQGIAVKIDLSHPVLSYWRRQRINKLRELGQIDNFDNYYQQTRERVMNTTREKLITSSERRDELVAQVIHSIDDLQKSINLAANRLSELYSLHFPEIVDLINNPLTLAKLVVSKTRRSEIDKEYLEELGIPKHKIKLIMLNRDDSLGGNLSDEDMIPIRDYARSLMDLHERKKQLEAWIEKTMGSIAPNLTAVAGSHVGARLIAGMGSLRELAMKSSSKVQVIGAEKALFSAIRGRGTPPKHGVIFQIPEIGNSPFWLRGKISRAFAAKISVASRLDEFGGEFLGDEMRLELREYVNELREKYPRQPPKKKKKAKQHPKKKRRKKK